MTKAFTVVIPARYASTRLPGKPLQDIAGQPMIQRVWNQARKSAASRVVVATDDERILAACQGFGAEALLTRAEHNSGTDRLEEVASRLGLASDAIVVNVQGDEPLIPPALIDQVAANLAAHPEAAIATLAEPIHEVSALFNPNVVKVATDIDGLALTFSRAPLPWARDAFARDRDSLPEGVPYRRHIGIYAYRVGFLADFVAWGPCWLENAESLSNCARSGTGCESMWPMPAKTCFRAWIRRKTLNAFAACWGLMRVLFVCLGNICRSPTAEGVFRRKVEEAGLASRIHVDSAGTAGWHVGKAPDQRTRLAAQRRGYDLSALRGRQVGIEDFSRHDLILAMDLSNLADLETLRAGRGAAELDLFLRRYGSERDEVPDPYYGGEEGFEQVLDLIEHACDRLLIEAKGRL